MSSILANIATRKRLTSKLLEQYRGFPDPAERLFGIAYKQPGMPTYDDIRDIYMRVVKERGFDDANALLQRYGVDSHLVLFSGLYRSFYSYASTVLNFGVSPKYAINEGEIPPNEIRDRWLLWHEGSESLDEARGKLPPELDRGDVDDVSGVPEFETRWLNMKSRK